MADSYASSADWWKSSLTPLADTVQDGGMVSSTSRLGGGRGNGRGHNDKKNSTSFKLTSSTSREVLTTPPNA